MYCEENAMVMTEKEADKYAVALAYAAEKHFGQLRIGGQPYIVHPIIVAEKLRAKGYGIDYIITGLFHDLLEDTDATEDKIAKIGGERVLRAVKLLTKYPGYVMSDYIAGIKSDEMAFAVKAADRLHNLETTECCDDDFRRRYVLETINWYLDFSEEIRQIVKKIAKSLDPPITDIFGYDPIDVWKLDNKEK